MSKFGRWSANDVYRERLDDTWPDVVGGMVLIRPETIDYTGSFASITGKGSVKCIDVSSVSLNGVFSSTYDNYMIVINDNWTRGAPTDYTVLRFRAAGTDDSTSSGYTYQSLLASSTSVTAARASSTSGQVSVSGSVYGGNVLWVYGPFLAQPTAVRSITCSALLDGHIGDYAMTHNQSTSYDGITLFTTTATHSFLGKIAVYGLRG